MSPQINNYLNYVHAQLAILDRTSKGEAKASYDTGYGLHIVDVSSTELGDDIHIMDVLPHSILKIDPPKSSLIQGEDWYTAWRLGVELVNRYINNNLTKKS